MRQSRNDDARESGHGRMMRAAAALSSGNQEVSLFISMSPGSRNSAAISSRRSFTAIPVTPGGGCCFHNTRTRDFTAENAENAENGRSMGKGGNGGFFSRRAHKSLSLRALRSQR